MLVLDGLPGDLAGRRTSLGVPGRSVGDDVGEEIGTGALQPTRSTVRYQAETKKVISIFD
jgi:hypothetical protein